MPVVLSLPVRSTDRRLVTSPYVTLSTRIAYENPWTRLREDRIRRPDGSDGIYGVVERSDFVVVVPIQDGRVTLVEQYRYPVQARMWEFPMGMWENTPRHRSRGPGRGGAARGNRSDRGPHDPCRADLPGSR